MVSNGQWLSNADVNALLANKTVVHDPVLIGDDERELEVLVHRGPPRLRELSW